jgi:hypothetical protein
MADGNLSVEVFAAQHTVDIVAYCSRSRLSIFFSAGACRCVSLDARRRAPCLAMSGPPERQAVLQPP